MIIEEGRFVDTSEYYSSWRKSVVGWSDNFFVFIQRNAPTTRGPYFICCISRKYVTKSTAYKILKISNSIHELEKFISLVSR